MFRSDSEVWIITPIFSTCCCRGRTCSILFKFSETSNEVGVCFTDRGTEKLISRVTCASEGWCVSRLVACGGLLTWLGEQPVCGPGRKCQYSAASERSRAEGCRTQPWSRVLSCSQQHTARQIGYLPPLSLNSMEVLQWT